MKTTINYLVATTKTLLVITALMTVGISSCKKDSPTEPSESPVSVNYLGSFVRSNDQVTTSATGNATANFNPSSGELTYSISWNNLGSAPIDMHFHDAGPIIHEITGFTSAKQGTLSGEVTLTAGQANDLAAGKIYIQIHSETFPGGEVIATLTKENAPSNPPGNNDDYDY